MEKEIIYKGKKLNTEIKWSSTAYCISIDGRGFKAFENTHDLQNFFYALNGVELPIKDN